MEREDYLWWYDFRDKKGNTITYTEYDKIMELHAKYFNHKLKKLCKCKPSGIQKYIDDINEIYAKSPKPKIR